MTARQQTDRPTGRSTNRPTNGHAGSQGSFTSNNIIRYQIYERNFTAYDLKKFRYFFFDIIVLLFKYPRKFPKRLEAVTLSCFSIGELVYQIIHRLCLCLGFRRPGPGPLPRVQPLCTGNQVPMYRVFIKYCVFFEDFNIFRALAFLVFPGCQCVYTHQASMQNTSAAAELAEFRKIQKF